MTLRKPAGELVRWNYKSRIKLERDSIDRACGPDGLSSGTHLRYYDRAFTWRYLSLRSFHQHTLDIPLRMVSEGFLQSSPYNSHQSLDTCRARDCMAITTSYRPFLSLLNITNISYMPFIATCLIFCSCRCSLPGCHSLTP